MLDKGISSFNERWVCLFFFMCGRNLFSCLNRCTTCGKQARRNLQQLQVAQNKTAAEQAAAVKQVQMRFLLT